MVRKTFDVAIVGAGILGLAHAYIAARAGKSVVVFEKSSHATGASVRNFGMVWPIGQPAGEMLQIALRSREIWLEILDVSKLCFCNTGSLHLTYRRDEADVAKEFAEIAPSLGYACQWLESSMTLQKSKAVHANGLVGALWSETELTVDPREILGSLPKFLEQRFGVQFKFDTLVKSIELPTIDTTAGVWNAETVIVCSGEDFLTLYPELYASSGLTRCKLQMMRTAPQPGDWQLGPSLAAGLTLRFYPAFQVCKTLSALSKRISEETPEYDRWGIHALVSQTSDGALTLGDSHEYGLEVDIFNKQQIDDLIFDYTRGFLRAPDLTIAERWYGVYAKHPDKPLAIMDPEPGVRIVASPGGSGMTLSFGVAERTMKELGILNA